MILQTRCQIAQAETLMHLFWSLSGGWFVEWLVIEQQIVISKYVVINKYQMNGWFPD